MGTIIIVDMLYLLYFLSKFDISKVFCLALYICFIYLLSLDTIDRN